LVEGLCLEICHVNRMSVLFVRIVSSSTLCIKISRMRLDSRGPFYIPRPSSCAGYASDGTTDAGSALLRGASPNSASSSTGTGAASPQRVLEGNEMGGFVEMLLIDCKRAISLREKIHDVV